MATRDDDNLTDDDPATLDERAWGVLDRLRTTRKPLQARAQRTRRKVLHAARDAFDAKGFEATTVKDIAAKARVSQGAIYEHFSNKRAILMEVGEMEVARIKDDSFRPFTEAAARKLSGSVIRADELVRVAILNSFDARRRYPRLLAILDEMASRDPDFAQVVVRYETEAIAALRELIVLFDARPDNIEATRAARFLFRTCQALVQHVALRGDNLNEDEDDLTDELTLTIMRYLFGHDPDLTP